MVDGPGEVGEHFIGRVVAVLIGDSPLTQPCLTTLAGHERRVRGEGKPFPLSLNGRGMVAAALAAQPQRPIRQRHRFGKVNRDRG